MDRLRRLVDSERAADLLLWVVIALPVLLSGDVPLWLRIAGVPLLGVAVVLSRRLPVAAPAVPVAMSLVASVELFTNSFTLAMVALAFLMGRRTDGVRGALVLFCTASVAGLVPVAVLGVTLWDWFTLLATVLFALVLPWLLGRNRRQYAELVRTGWELAERLESEQTLIADRTRLRERSRIAGDMHDSLGHELSLIALRAAALQVSPGLGEHERAAAGELRQAAATATQQLREIIGVLRMDGEGAPVLPAGDTVEALVARAAASGMAVELVREGSGGPLSPMADRAVHRVVQEALTNATKHAPGAPVTVTLVWQAETVEITVTNETPPPAPFPGPGPDPGPSPSGYGLVGLDERVRLAGGILRAGPSAGGYEVSARLPLAPGAEPTPPSENVSRRELALARLKVRRGTLAAIWVPITAVAVLGVLMFGFNLYTSYRSVLDTDVYDRLRTGASESDIEPQLPDYELDDNRPPDGAPAAPQDSDNCRFYRTGPHTFTPAYRLCFTDGRLSHKDMVEIAP
ncbi:sensor histidine kinase [Streptomyces sp. NPDC058409]|uniref:sensor histidine kinase n=1 Tax=Streptomyces sp. NPDC058409 TaxID=3346484 RepID=UPI003669BA30